VDWRNRLARPDAGGGKHLIRRPDTKAMCRLAITSPFILHKVLVAIRSLPVKGDVKGNRWPAFDQNLPTRERCEPKLLFIDITEEDGRHVASLGGQLKYWEVLHRIINAEPVVDEFRPMYGMLAAVGIEKGKPFAPDARLKGILERAAKVGRDQMLVAAFASDRLDKIAWSDRKWEWVGLIADNSDFETPTGLDLEARDRWFAQAIVASPAMFRRSPGAGSLC
jgi:hypothetical protein